MSLMQNKSAAGSPQWRIPHGRHLPASLLVISREPIREYMHGLMNLLVCMLEDGVLLACMLSVAIGVYGSHNGMTPM